MSSDDDNDAVRRRRAVLAGHAGDARAARAALRDPAPGVRASALGALARLDDLQTDELTAGLNDADPAVRARACELTGARAGTGPPSLIPCLRDTDATVVEVAAWACGEREPAEPGVVPVLSELATTHDDALVREAAVAALGAIGDEAGLAAILSATRDKPAVRRRAVIALAPFDGPDVTAALAAARDDRDWQVRQAAEDLSD